MKVRDLGVYPDNFVLEIQKNGVRVTYSQNISEDLIPYLDKRNIGKGKKFLFYIVGGMVNPLNSINLSYAYNQLKAKCQREIAEAKVKLSEAKLNQLKARDEKHGQGILQFPPL